MPTSVHIPGALLTAVDQRAKALKVSRNRFIVRTLERELARATEWTPGFFDFLRQVDPKDARLADEMLANIQQARRSKKRPVQL
jgi:metal-responsive CopG/Arc/MetJ family transcriptional regulator